MNISPDDKDQTNIMGQYETNVAGKHTSVISSVWQIDILFGRLGYF